MYPPYINQSDFEAMAKVLKGINKVILQKYKPVELGSQKTYSILVLEEFKEILIKTKINTEIR